MKKVLSIAVLAIALYSCDKQKVSQDNYTVNEASSKVEWKGSAKDHFHIGSFSVNGGLTVASNGMVTGGDFTIPVSSIKDYDLQDPLRGALLEDLLSANFFNVVLHPNAKFHITNVDSFTRQAKDTESVQGANYLVAGDFTMLGKSQRISFPARIIKTQDSVSTLADFTIDRTKWGMNIYSDPTQALYILPDVNIHLDVKAALKK